MSPRTYFWVSTPAPHLSIHPSLFLSCTMDTRAFFLRMWKNRSGWTLVFVHSFISFCLVCVRTHAYVRLCGEYTHACVYSPHNRDYCQTHTYERHITDDPSTTESWDSSWVDCLDTTQLSREFASSSWQRSSKPCFKVLNSVRLGEKHKLLANSLDSR